MSLLNVHIEPNLALIAFDTLALDSRSTELQHASKVIHFPHANFVIGVRGNAGVMFTLAGILFTQPFTVDIEQAIYIVGDVLNASKPEEVGEDIEILLVGWSNIQKRMVGHAFIKTKGNDAIKGSQVGSHVGPNVGWTSAPPMRTAAEMLQIATQQVAHLRGLGHLAIGGNLMLAEMTQRGTYIHQAAQLTQECSATERSAIADFLSADTP